MTSAARDDTNGVEGGGGRRRHHHGETHGELLPMPLLVTNVNTRRMFSSPSPSPSSSRSESERNSLFSLSRKIRERVQSAILRKERAAVEVTAVTLLSLGSFFTFGRAARLVFHHNLDIKIFLLSKWL